MQMPFFNGRIVRIVEMSRKNNGLFTGFRSLIRRVEFAGAVIDISNHGDGSVGQQIILQSADLTTLGLTQAIIRNLLDGWKRVVDG